MIANLAAFFGHFYPLYSGCGLIANSAFFRWLDRPGQADSAVRVTGGQAVVPAGDYVGRAMRFIGDLDPKVSWVIDRSMLPGDIALDIGGNLGLVSLRMAARTGSDGAVHTFEPQPRLQEYLRRTVELNPQAPITLHAVALGETHDEMVLTVPKDNSGAASLLERSWPGLDEIRVPVVPLGDYAVSAGIPRADVVKIDVEGFEAQVLTGARAFFEAHPPRVIVMEENAPYPEGGTARSLQLLNEYGYDLFGLPKQAFRVRLQPLAERPDCHDFVAVHRSCPQEVRHRLGLAPRH